jgi:hypothetical protein
MTPPCCRTCGRSGRDFELVRGECRRCYTYRRTHGGQPRPADLPPGGPPTGPDHFAWKGDLATRGAGHQRAQQRFPLGPCERCGRPGRERHHRDENTLNNAPENVLVLCRRYHQAIDGRLAAFVAAGAPYRRVTQQPKPCATCGRPWKPLRRGECKACADYRGRHGHARPERLWRTPP